MFLYLRYNIIHNNLKKQNIHNKLRGLEYMAKANNGGIYNTDALKNLGLLEFNFIRDCIDRSEWLTWSEICSGLGWDSTKKGDSKRAYVKILKAYFIYETQGNTKGTKYRFTNIKDNPYFRLGKGGDYAELIDYLLIHYLSITIKLDNPKIILYKDIYDFVGTRNSNYKYLLFSREDVLSQLCVTNDVLCDILDKQQRNDEDMIDDSLKRLEARKFIAYKPCFALQVNSGSGNITKKATSRQIDKINNIEIDILGTDDEDDLSDIRFNMILTNKYQAFKQEVIREYNKDEEVKIENYYKRAFFIRHGLVQFKSRLDNKDVQVLKKILNEKMQKGRYEEYIKKEPTDTTHPFLKKINDEYNRQVKSILDGLFNIQTKKKITLKKNSLYKSL